MTNYTAPVQIVVDTEKLLDQIGWHDYGYDRDGEPYEEGGPIDLRNNLAAMVAQELARTLRNDMEKAVRAKVEEVAAARAAVIVNEVIDGDIRQTNSFGEPVGEPTTLRALVVEQVKAQLAAKVGRDGRPSGYGRDGKTVVEWAAENAARDALRGELANAAAGAVGEVKARVQAIVADELGAQIAKAVTR